MKAFVVIGLIAVFLQAILAVPVNMDADGNNIIERRAANCTVYKTNNSGIIISPNYPGNYYNNMDCYYRITPQIYQTYEMKLYFCDFNVESSVVFGCADYLSISGQKYCGNRSGQSFKFTKYGSFEMNFHTDYRTTKRGFKISYCAGCSNWNDLKARCNRRYRRSKSWPYDYFDQAAWPSQYNNSSGGWNNTGGYHH